MDDPTVIPCEFAFRFEWPISPLPEINFQQKSWVPESDEFSLPSVETNSRELPYDVKLYLGWNAQGLGLRFRFDRLSSTPESLIQKAAESDGLQIWIDTRNTQNVHRATKFCHHFCCLPATGKNKNVARVVQLPVARAREEQEMATPDSIPCRSHISADKYEMEVWWPTAVLQGFDPASSPKLGFYWRAIHHDLPDQFLTVGMEFPVDADPSLWQTLSLK